MLSEKRVWPILRFCPIVRIEELRGARKSISHGCRFPERDTIRVHPECKSDALILCHPFGCRGLYSRTRNDRLTMNC